MRWRAISAWPYVLGGAEPVKAGSTLWAIIYGLLYLGFASSIILLNKHVLAVTPFHFPITLASLGVGPRRSYSPRPTVKQCRRFK